MSVVRNTRVLQGSSNQAAIAARGNQLASEEVVDQLAMVEPRTRNPPLCVHVADRPTEAAVVGGVDLDVDHPSEGAGEGNAIPREFKCAGERSIGEDRPFASVLHAARRATHRSELIPGQS